MTKKKFRLFDAVLAAVCIVLVVESAPGAAAIGNSQFFWWIFLLLGFFMPYGLISAELGTAYEDEGGIYDWVKRAFGKRWGSRVAWYYYINFPLWMGSLAVLFTDLLSSLFGVTFSVFAAVLLQLLFIWTVVFASGFNVSENKWLLNTAAIFKALIMLSLGVLGIYVALTRGSANAFTPESFIPSFSASGLSNISVIIFNFLGFEVVTTFASEMKNPGREIPKALVLGGVLIAFFYILASFGIGVAIPADELAASGGLIESFMSLTGKESGLIITVFSLMFIYTLFTNLVSWSFGVNYVAGYAAKEGSLPKVFGAEDKKGMPLGANIANGVIASLVVLSAPLIPSPDLFWSFFALNMVTLLMAYIPIFPAFLKLRKIDPERNRPYKVGGKSGLLKLYAYLPMVLLCISVVLSVIPLNLSSDELGTKLPLLLGTVLAVIIGEVIAARAEKTQKG